MRDYCSDERVSSEIGHHRVGGGRLERRAKSGRVLSFGTRCISRWVYRKCQLGPDDELSLGRRSRLRHQEPRDRGASKATASTW